MKKTERVGRAFAPRIEHGIYTMASGFYVASVDIGDYYYETDRYGNKEAALDELRGCLLEIQDRIAKILKEIP